MLKGWTQQATGSKQRTFAGLLRLLASVVTLSCVSVPVAGAADLLLIRGEGDDVGIIGAAVRTREWKSWPPTARWRYSVSGEWQLARWHAQQADAKVSSIVDGSLTSVLTLRPLVPLLSNSYVEVGLGIHLISHQSINQDRGFGTSFQFGEFLGLGTHLGARDQYSIGLRIQHVSNGRIKEPNDGVTFAQAVVRYNF